MSIMPFVDQKIQKILNNTAVEGNLFGPNLADLLKQAQEADKLKTRLKPPRERDQNNFFPRGSTYKFRKKNF